MTTADSRLPGFYQEPIAERRAIVQSRGGLSPRHLAAVEDSGLTTAEADAALENVIGRYSLPFAVAANFRVNERDFLVPMVIEESSVVAACSYAAKTFRATGGFCASSDEPVMIGQIQIVGVSDLPAASERLGENRCEIIARANQKAGSLVARGGGAIDIETRLFAATPAGPMLILHLLFDTREAMGANALNTALEHIAPLVERISGGRVNLRILSNLSDRRLARASGKLSPATLGADGEAVIDGIIEAAVWSEIDPYRAATHNKGVMNGIDALLIATGNDWRAVEAGAHAYAARDGQYRGLTRWRKDEAGDLHGSLELPMALGTVGGMTRVHRGAKAALALLGSPRARELAELAAAVGLAQNFAALRALATDGIQSGHMRMHARQLALAAGASAEEAGPVARRMFDVGEIRLERAKAILNEGREQT